MGALTLTLTLAEGVVFGSFSLAQSQDGDSTFLQRFDGFGRSSQTAWVIIVMGCAHLIRPVYCVLSIIPLAQITDSSSWTNLCSSLPSMLSKCVRANSFQNPQTPPPAPKVTRKDL